MVSARRKNSREFNEDPLVISIDRIDDETGLDVNEAVTAAWLDAALGSESPFRASSDGRVLVHITRLDEVVHVRGRARLALSAPCSRCVNPTSLALDTPIEIALFPKGTEPPANADGSLTDEDMGVATYENDEINLGTIVHDEVFLELPMNPLCQESCKGLCQQCGTDLNETTCKCEKATDMRWSALGKIKLS